MKNYDLSKGLSLIPYTTSELPDELELFRDTLGSLNLELCNVDQVFLNEEESIRFFENCQKILPIVQAIDATSDCNSVDREGDVLSSLVNFNNIKINKDNLNLPDSLTPWLSNNKIQVICIDGRKIKTEARWEVVMVANDDYVDFEINIGSYSSEKEAEDVVDSLSSDPYFILVDERPALYLIINGERKFYYDDNVIIKKLTDEKKAQLSLNPTLDMNKQADRDIAVSALESNNSEFIVEQSDMVETGETLGVYIEKYGVGYSPSYIGYFINKKG